MSVGSGRAILGKGREEDGGFCTVGDFHGGFLSAHFGLYPARVDGVDFDRGVFKVVGEVESVGVDGRFADVVCGCAFEVVDW